MLGERVEVRHPVRRSRSATASDDDEDGGEAARAYPVAFDDDEEEDDDDSDLDGAAAAAPLARSRFLQRTTSPTNTGGAMTRLLSSEGHGGPRAVPSYGADGSRAAEIGEAAGDLRERAAPSHAAQGRRRGNGGPTPTSRSVRRNVEKEKAGGFTFAQALPACVE